MNPNGVGTTGHADGRRSARGNRPGIGPARATWSSTLERDRRSLLACKARRAPDRIRELAQAAPRLLDSVYRPELVRFVAGLPPGVVRTHAGLAYVTGVVASHDGRSDEACSCLAQALAHADRSDRAFVARVGLQLGTAYLICGERVVADAVLAGSEAVDATADHPSADRLLLEALLRKDVGDHRAAVPLYRLALVHADSALTPATRVLCLVNLAIAEEHADPRESIALCRLALATIEAERLSPDLGTNVLNVEGYARICQGDFASARVALSAALGDAQALGLRLVALRARFNTAIIDELEGDLAGANRRLAELERDASDPATGHLGSWASIRRAWIGLERSDDAAARAIVDGTHGLPRSHWEAIDTLRGRLALHNGDLDRSQTILHSLADAYREKADELTEMVLLLWCAHAEQLAGRTGRARKLIGTACEIGTRRGFVVSPNWWSGRIVDCTRRLADGTPMSVWARSLRSPVSHGNDVAPARDVTIDRDGNVIAGGAPLDAGRWSGGGTGSHVLRRYLRMLAAAYPGGLPRDQLADTLWPESDGDRARSNLYAATSDLRKVIRGVDGLSILRREGMYALDVGANVTILR